MQEQVHNSPFHILALGRQRGMTSAATFARKCLSHTPSNPNKISQRPLVTVQPAVGHNVPEQMRKTMEPYGT